MQFGKAPARHCINIGKGVGAVGVPTELYPLPGSKVGKKRSVGIISVAAEAVNGLCHRHASFKLKCLCFGDLLVNFANGGFKI